MNILIYISELSQQGGGIKQYSIGLLRLLSEDPSNKYFIYHNNNDVEILKVIENYPQLELIQDGDVIYQKPGDIIKKSNYFIKKLRSAKGRLVKKIKANKEELKITLSFIDTLCSQYGIDVIHCPYQYIPRTKKVKLIITLHDVQEIHFPEYFSAETRAYRANAYLDFVRRADFIIVSYDHVKKDIIKYFDVASEKIGIFLLKMENLWFARFSESDITDLSSLNLPDKFLLYPANTWKHKNHLRLIEAVAIANEKYQIGINLVCTGHTNEHFAEIEKVITRLNLGKKVLFTGVVDEPTLYSLYKSCRGVVIPTSYEAGSFPLYESILLNVPVICSNVTSLPDTIGKEEFIFDPINVDDMAQKMLLIWQDENFRTNNLKQLEVQRIKIKENNPLLLLQEMYKKLSA